MVDEDTNRRTINGGVFVNIMFYKRMRQNQLILPTADNLPLCNINAPYVFVADDAFTLMEKFIKLFSNRNLSKPRLFIVTKCHDLIE